MAVLLSKNEPTSGFRSKYIQIKIAGLRKPRWDRSWLSFCIFEYLRIYIMKSVIPFFCLATILFLTHCSGKCTYKVFAEIPNIKHNYRIVKFYNWCGSTSSNNNNLSLLGVSDSIDDRQRIVFVVNSTVGENLDRDTTVRITWVNDSSILISYDRSLIVIQKESILDNVSIKYMLKWFSKGLSS